MRKRSDVAAADPRQQSIPGTAPPAPAAAAPPPPPSSPRPRAAQAVPDHVEVDHGIVYIKCPDCGLKQSSDSAKRKTMPSGASLLHCMRCNGLLDPDEELSEEFIARLKATPAGAAPAPAPVPKAEDKKPEPPPPAKPAATSAKPCVVCGGGATATSSGVFYPCGHKQTKAPKADRHEVPVGETVEGESVTACFGEEKFSPRQYQNFAIGPYFRSTKVQPGETPAQALARANEELRQFANIEFKQKAKDFLDRLEWLDKEVGNRGGSR